MIAAAGGNIDGRTAAQKLCYFAGEIVGQDLGHRAHYYGPYSRPVENALNNSAFAGDIDETVRLFDSGRAYHYGLTDQGRTTVAELREKYPDLSLTIDQTIKRLGELVPNYRQHPLSLAAKVDLIVRQQGRQGNGIPSADIPELAKQLGWNVSDHDVEQAVEILVGLGRVTTSES